MRLTLAIRVLFVVGILLFQIPVTTYAANCQFVLGFKTFHDLLPSTVGDCLVNEHHNPQNGDALQETSKGLLVWRKSDNFTAFTDGYHTWVNGPLGMQKRLNTEQFPWETTSQACTLSDKNVSFAGFSPGAGGAESSSLKIINPCLSTIDVMIDATAETSKGGAPVMDAPTVEVTQLAAGQTKIVVSTVPAGASGPWISTHYWWFKDSDRTNVCVNVGASACLKTDGWLISAIDDLNQLNEGQTLLRTAADHGVTLTRGKTDVGVLGFYSPPNRQITLDTRLDAYSSWVRAAVLAHELQHASDDVLGQLDTSSLGCYLAEARAFTTESTVWSLLWQDKLPPNVDSMHTELNDITITVFGDPANFAQALIQSYQSECGG
jgi:hypothetical protein